MYIKKSGFLLGLCVSHVMYAQHAYSLFGYPLASRIGIAACPVTSTSEGVQLAAESDFDVVTYKTIRSIKAPIKSPYIHYVDVHDQLTHSDIGARYTVINEPTANDLAITNCYGMGSEGPEESIEDIQRARASLAEGQVLIVSIYGSGDDARAQLNDFVRVAQIAAAGGAQIIEVNLSCPNLAGTKLMYKEPSVVHTICALISSTIPDIPLTIKVGVFDSFEQMRDVIIAAHSGGARGICGINTVPIRAEDGAGNPVYGTDRLVSGLSGAPIHDLAMEFTRQARFIIDTYRLDIALCATGGIMKPQDFDDLFTAGADVVLCATGAMLNMNLGLEYKKNSVKSPINLE